MIYIPHKLKVGFRERSGTYTGKLAYVIYQDAKNKWRKEPSWNSWRDETIEPEHYDNTPTEGFVLNKKVGGVAYSSWDARQTYCRVYDPRGFEFEITIPNLLYILQNTNSIKGKGLEGTFVYGWDGTELLLIPTGAPEYAELKDVSTKTINAKRFTAKDMIPGATYLNDKGEKLIYLDRAERYGTSSWDGKGIGTKFSSKYYYFMRDNETSIIHMSTLTKKIIECVDTAPHPRFAFFIDELNKRPEYVRIAPELDEYVIMEPNEILEWYANNRKSYYQYRGVYVNVEGEYVHTHIRNRGYNSTDEWALETEIRGWRRPYDSQWCTLEELINKHTFYKRIRYLANGKIHSIGA